MKPDEHKGFGIFWRLFGLVISRLVGEHAHAEVVLILADGKIQRIRVNRSFLPEDIGSLARELPSIPGNL